MKTETNSHCVVYRTGGTENFKWNRSLAMSRDEADNRQGELKRMGYRAMVVNYKDSLSIGLPETFEV